MWMLFCKFLSFTLLLLSRHPNWRISCELIWFFSVFDGKFTYNLLFYYVWQSVFSKQYVILTLCISFGLHCWIWNVFSASVYYYTCRTVVRMSHVLSNNSTFIKFTFGYLNFWTNFNRSKGNLLIEFWL